MSTEGKPQPFTADNLGRGTTLEKAINNAIAKKGGSHGDVYEVKLYVSVSNPHIGEYIVDLG
jgi:hypothetical protein